NCGSSRPLRDGLRFVPSARLRAIALKRKQSRQDRSRPFPRYGARRLKGALRRMPEQIARRPPTPVVARSPLREAERLANGALVQYSPRRSADCAAAQEIYTV